MTLPHGLLLGILFLAVPQTQQTDLNFFGVQQPELLPPSTPALHLEFVQEYGGRDEGLVFGKIVDLAVSESGTLAVLDAYGCQVWMVDTKTGETGTVGGCGDGPGEFRNPQVATFSGDTLLVWDFGRASMVKLDPEGEEIERSIINPFEIGAGTITDLHAGRGGSILAGLDLLPSGVSQEHRQLAEFDRFGGSIEKRGLGAPPLARTTPRNMLRSVSFCVGSNTRQEEVVLALNHWGPQVALLRRSDLEVLQSVRIPLEWVRSQDHPRLGPGHWGPMVPNPRAACGSRYAVAGYRDQGAGPDGELAVFSAAMVLFDLWENTMTVLGGDDPPEPGSVLLMTPGAATGNQFFLFSNSFFDHPVVREYRVVSGEKEE